MKFTLLPIWGSLLLSFATSASAHHGQDFFLLDDTRIPAAGHGLALGTFAYEDEGEDDTLSYSTGVLLGLLPRTALSLQADFMDEAGSGWEYRSVTPGFHFDLTPTDLKLPVRFGISAAYQFAETPDTAHHQEEPDAHGHDGDAGHHEETAHHEEPEHEEAGHEHSGIHNHDDSLFIGRFIVEADLTPTTLLVANVISVLPDGKSAAWGYGLGLRQKLRPDFSIGVEAVGDFDRHGEHEVIGAVYWEPTSTSSSRRGSVPALPARARTPASALVSSGCSNHRDAPLTAPAGPPGHCLFSAGQCPDPSRCLSNPPVLTTPIAQPVCPTPSPEL